jgi:hypothetical protein
METVPPKRCSFTKLHGDCSHETVMLSVAELYRTRVPVFFYLENIRCHTWFLRVEACGTHTYHFSVPFVWPCVKTAWGWAWDAVLQDPVCGVKVSLMRVTVPWRGNRPFHFITRLQHGPALQLNSTWGTRRCPCGLLNANFRCNQSASLFLLSITRLSVVM